MTRRCLVTGGGGFLGGHLVTVLKDRGFRVRTFDLSYRTPMKDVEALAGSILDEAALTKAFEACDAIIHAAAMTDLWARDTSAYDRVNRGGTALVARLARERRIRMVHVSSYTTLVSRKVPKGRLTDETALIAPRDTCGPYPASKRRGELAVLAEAERGLDACIVLPAAPIGPGDRRPTPPARLLRDLATGALPALLETPMNLVGVRAVAEAIVTAIDEGRRGDRYLLSGENMPLSRIAGIVSALGFAPAPKARVPHAVALAAATVEAGIGRFGRPPTAPLTGVRIAGRAPKFRNDTARAVLDFHPPKTEEAVAAALSWMVREGMVPAPEPKEAQASAPLAG